MTSTLTAAQKTTRRTAAPEVLTIMTYAYMYALHAYQNKRRIYGTYDTRTVNYLICCKHAIKVLDRNMNVWCLSRNFDVLRCAR